MATSQLLCAACVKQALDASQVVCVPPATNIPETVSFTDLRRTLGAMGTAEVEMGRHLWFDGVQLRFAAITIQDGDLMCLDHVQ